MKKMLDEIADIPWWVIYALTVVLIACSWISAKPTPRPQPVSVQTYSDQSEFRTASGSLFAIGVNFDPPYWGEVEFDHPVSGVGFQKEIGTTICCYVTSHSAVEYSDPYCGGPEGTYFGVGTSPTPRIVECYIDGFASAISFY